MIPLFVRHIDLNTGRLEANPEGSIDPRAIDACRATLEHSFHEQGLVPLPFADGYSLSAASGSGMLATIWKGGDSVTHIAVAGTDVASKNVWPLIHAIYPRLSSQPEPPQWPWLAHRRGDASAPPWLAHYVRCLAWAWLARDH